MGASSRSTRMVQKSLVPTACGQKTGEWCPHFVPSSLPLPDVTLSPWSGDNKCHQRRVLTYTIPISNPLGPKSASVVETQVGLGGGQSGRLGSPGWLWGTLTPSSLLPTDTVPARPPGGRLRGGLRGADPGHPVPGLLLHCPPLLHPGPCPQQGPAAVSSGPAPPLTESPASGRGGRTAPGLSTGPRAAIHQDGEGSEGQVWGKMSSVWDGLSCLLDPGELGHSSKTEESGPGAGSAAGGAGRC